MKVSVVVPLYNKAKWVHRSLESIAAQTFRNFEVIVVDDGSTDGSGEIAEAFPDPRFRVVKQENAGPGAARNRGIAEAQGELIAFLDADDEWMPEFLERMVQTIETAGPRVAVAVCGYYELPAGVSRERMWRRRGIREGVFRATPTTSPRRLVNLLAYMNPWATISRKRVLWRHGGFFGRERCLYGEDAFLWLKVLLNEPVAVTFEPLVRFHTEASSLSKNLRRARPIEPFLKYPEELEMACPRHLKDLLRGVLSIRASKTACMLSYWGRWREAREILSRFREGRSVFHPYALTAAVSATPVGAAAGRAWRSALAWTIRREKTSGAIATSGPIDVQPKPATADGQARQPTRAAVAEPARPETRA